MYVGSPKSQALLLWQSPIGEGPYLKALHKRGAGLHHIAIAVTDFAAYHQQLSELGWLLHPNSLNGYKVGSTVYYVRPGVHTVLELIPQSELLMGERFVTGLEIPTEKRLAHMITGLELPGVVPAVPGGFRLSIGDRTWTLQDFLSQDAS